MRKRSLATVTVGLMILLAPSVAAEAADIKVLSAAAMRPVLNELGPRFERETGHKLVIQYNVIGMLKRQIEGGEPFDVALLSTPFIEDLAKQGKIASGTPTNIARSGIGVFVRTGGPKPDIKSADAFKRTMLNAKSIGYSKEGATAMHLAGVFERLGIAEPMKAKTKYVPPGEAATSIAKGEAELGLVVIAAVEPTAGVELLGPLPADLQSYIGYTGGVGAAAKEAKAGKAFIDFLKAPAAVPVLKAKGMEPIL